MWYWHSWARRVFCMNLMQVSRGVPTSYWRHSASSFFCFWQNGVDSLTSGEEPIYSHFVLRASNSYEHAFTPLLSEHCLNSDAFATHSRLPPCTLHMATLALWASRHYSFAREPDSCMQSYRSALAPSQVRYLKSWILDGTSTGFSALSSTTLHSNSLRKYWLKHYSFSMPSY